MSISSYQVHSSGALARRFASLVASYMDDPTAAKSETAKVPLENVYRMLEMFRYDAFADDSRLGVLALETLEGDRPASRERGSPWHTSIAQALDSALMAAYGAQKSKEEAVVELQDSLRRLAVEGAVDEPNAQHARTFFSTLRASLA